MSQALSRRSPTRSRPKRRPRRARRPLPSTVMRAALGGGPLPHRCAVVGGVTLGETSGRQPEELRAECRVPDEAEARELRVADALVEALRARGFVREGRQQLGLTRHASLRGHPDCQPPTRARGDRHRVAQLTDESAALVVEPPGEESPQSAMAQEPAAVVPTDGIANEEAILVQGEVAEPLRRREIVRAALASNTWTAEPHHAVVVLRRTEQDPPGAAELDELRQFEFRELAGPRQRQADFP